MNLDVYREFIEKNSVLDFAGLIDHTLLRPDANYKLLEKYIEDMRRYKFKLLMIPLSLANKVRELAGNTIDIGVVVGFPLGNTSTRTKVTEVIEAAENNAIEVDMVMNINAFKSGDFNYVLHDVKTVVDTAKNLGLRAVKVIIETGLLTDEEKVKATEIVSQSGADFVKTCTGFLGGVATIHDVRLLKKASKNRIRVKASGGIRYAIDAVQMIINGASRIGTSSGDKIIEEYIKMREER
ncbi:MAG: deoxyribose-phosphate aldolase [Desulfurococcaceae archaeon]